MMIGLERSTVLLESHRINTTAYFYSVELMELNELYTTAVYTRPKRVQLYQFLGKQEGLHNELTLTGCDNKCST
jgi:hypothetical protein